MTQCTLSEYTFMYMQQMQSAVSAVCHLHLINTAKFNQLSALSFWPPAALLPRLSPEARTENRAAKMNISKGTFAKCVSSALTPKLQISTSPHSWHLFPVLCPKFRQGLEFQPRSRQGRPLRQRWPQAPCLHLRHHHHLSYHHSVLTWLILVSILEQHSLDIQTTVSCQDLQLRGSSFVSLDKLFYRCNRPLTTWTEKSK